MTEECGRPRLAVVGSHHVRRSVETHSIVACMDAPRETRHAWSCLPPSHADVVSGRMCGGFGNHRKLIYRPRCV